MSPLTGPKPARPSTSQSDPSSLDDHPTFHSMETAEFFNSSTGMWPSGQGWPSGRASPWEGCLGFTVFRFEGAAHNEVSLRRILGPAPDETL